jgi:hypothetical protein
MVYIPKEFCSAIKNAVMLSAGKWEELETIMVSETSQSHKDKPCWFLSLMEAKRNKNKTNNNQESPKS